MKEQDTGSRQTRKGSAMKNTKRNKQFVTGVRPSQARVYQVLAKFVVVMSGILMTYAVKPVVQYVAL